MLKKLIAYDFQCQWKMATALSAASLIAAIASSVCFQSGLSLIGSAGEDDVWQALFGMGLMLAFIFGLLIAMVAGSAVILAVGVHYYKKFVSDEAYLTFTLPATPSQHLTAKMISGSVWMGVSTLVLIADLLIIYIPMLRTAYGDLVVDATVEDMSMLSPVGAILMVAGYLLLIAVSVVSQVGLLYLSLTVGGILSQKHKAVAGVGIYFGADFVIGGIIQVISTVASVITGAAAATVDSTELLLILLPFINAVIFAAFTVAFVWINKHLLTKKLNLA